MGLLHGVILYASTFIVLMGMGLIWDVWRHKDSFEIAARSPMLLCLAGAAHVALVFLQMTAGVRTSQIRCSLTVVALAESAHISPRQHKRGAWAERCPCIKCSDDILCVCMCTQWIDLHTAVSTITTTAGYRPFFQQTITNENGLHDSQAYV